MGLELAENELLGGARREPGLTLAERRELLRLMDKAIAALEPAAATK